MFIYRITNIITQDTYIGQTTKTIKRRFACHKANARYGVETYLYRAMRKYGEENFTIEAVESQVSREALNEREKLYIAEEKPRYNMNEGGASGNAMTERHAKAMRDYHSKRTPESYATYGSLGTKRDTNTIIADKLGRMKPVCVKGKWFFSITEATEHYNIGRTTFYRWRDKGLVSF